MQINSKIPPTIAERRAELEIKGREELPQEWEQAIAACLSKDPNMRPSCAGVLAEMLGLKASTGTSRSVTFGSTQRSTAPLTPEPAKKERSSLPWLAAAAGAVLLAGGAAYYFGTLPESAGKSSTLVETEPDSPAKATTDLAATPSDPSTAQASTEAIPSTPEAAPKPDESAKMAAASPSEPAATHPTEPTAAAAEPVSPGSPASTVTAAATMPAAAPAATPPEAAAAASSAPAAGSGTMVAAVSPAQAAATSLPDSAPADRSTPAATPPGPGTAMPLEPSSSQVPASILSMPPAPGYVELPLPEGYVPPPNLRQQIFTQPNYVPDPPGGFWPHESIFPSVPFSDYTSTGRRHLLFLVQEFLKNKKLYDEQPDGLGSEETHIAIERFQAKNDLKANGLLDVPTLAAMNLSTEADNKEWKPPAPKPMSVPAKVPVAGPVTTPSIPRAIGPKVGNTPRVAPGGRYAPQVKEPNILERGLEKIQNGKDRE
jgi:hypothetical protein